MARVLPSQKGQQMRPLIALALLAAPAYAETCEYATAGTSVTIAPHDTEFAQVHISNRLAPRNYTDCDLTIYGVTVTVTYDALDFDAPDWFHVTVPPGFVAVPPSILLDERTTGQVLIVIDGGLGS
jgi:hypothetical protein